MDNLKQAGGARPWQHGSSSACVCVCVWVLPHLFFSSSQIQQQSKVAMDLPSSAGSHVLLLGTRRHVKALLPRDLICSRRIPCPWASSCPAMQQREDHLVRAPSTPGAWLVDEHLGAALSLCGASGFTAPRLFPTMRRHITLHVPRCCSGRHPSGSSRSSCQGTSTRSPEAQVHGALIAPASRIQISKDRGQGVIQEVCGVSLLHLTDPLPTLHLLHNTHDSNRGEGVHPGGARRYSLPLDAPDDCSAEAT